MARAIFHLSKMFKLILPIFLVHCVSWRGVGGGKGRYVRRPEGTNTNNIHLRGGLRQRQSKYEAEMQ